MVHCLPLPGTPNFGGDCLKIIQQAIDDAKTLEKSGVDAIIVENMGDVPFAAALDIPQIAALAIIANEVKNTIAIPVGIDANFNDYKSSLSIGIR